VSVFILFAKAVVVLTGIVVVLSAWIVLFNNRAIRREARANDNRLTLRGSLVRYLNGEVDLMELQKEISGNEKLLIGLAAQLAEEFGESARLKLIELFGVGDLSAVVQKEIRQLVRAYNWRRRQRAATFLPYIAKRELIIPLLLRSLEDKVFMVRFSAAHSLAKVKAIETIIPLLEHLSLPREWPAERTIEIINEMGREAITPLLSYLSMPEAKSECKIFALSALGMQQVREAIPVMLSYLHSPDKELRIQSAKALGNIGATEATQALCACMKDNAWEVRAASANALGLINNNQAIAVLVNSLGDPAWWVRYNSANALAELGSDGIAALNNAFSHNDKFAREVSRLVLQERSMFTYNQKSSAA